MSRFSIDIEAESFIIESLAIPFDPSLCRCLSSRCRHALFLNVILSYWNARLQHASLSLLRIIAALANWNLGPEEEPATYIPPAEEQCCVLQWLIDQQALNSMVSVTPAPRPAGIVEHLYNLS